MRINPILSPQRSSRLTPGHRLSLERVAAPALRLLVPLALAAGWCIAPALGANGPRAIDDPRSPGGGSDGLATSSWEFVTIPNLAPGSSLGALWAGASGDVYVWSTRQGGTTARTSTLHHFNGRAWEAALTLSSREAGSVFGTDANDVFASVVEIGHVKVYHYDGTGWSAMNLPDGALGPAGAFAGMTNDVYLRSGTAILHYDGSAWTKVLDDPSLAAGCGLVYVSPGEIYARSNTGHWLWDGSRWTWFAASGRTETMCTWGMRDAAGNLHLYATGCDNGGDGMHVWKFQEHTPGCMTGCWVTVLSDPDPTTGARSADVIAATPRRTDDDDLPGGGASSGGGGHGLWGPSGNVVYAIATIDGAGSIYRGNDQGWSRIDLLDSPLPAVRHIWGTGSESYWVTLADGRLLRSRGTGHDPDCSASIAFPGRLWPPTHALMPVRILGVTDPDGDRVTIRVTGITSDEPIGTQLGSGACPDALISNDQARLRAERVEGGNGRVYGITFQATDGRGGSSMGVVRVEVPAAAGGAAIDDGQFVNALGRCSGELDTEVPLAPRGPHIRTLPGEAGGVTLEYSLPSEGDVVLSVHDIAGRHVATLDRGLRVAGAHRLVWNTAAVAPGMYYCRLKAGDALILRSLLVLR